MQNPSDDDGTSTKINWKILSVKGLFPPFILSKDKYFIGRSESADIVLKDKSISGMHAALIINKNKVSIVDLDSTNGIYVNKEKVEQAELKKGDILTVGAVPLMLQVAQEGESNLSFSMGALFDQGDNHTSTKVVKPVTQTQEFSRILPVLPEAKSEKTGIFQDLTGTFIRKKEEKQVFRPTDIFPQAEYSAFIFEEEKEEEIVDIFVPAPAQEKSVEVVIMHSNLLLSIEYLTPKKKDYFLTGALKGKSYVNVPFLDTKNKAKLISVGMSGFEGFQVDGFKLIHFKSDGKMKEYNQPSYMLSDNEIYEYRKGEYKILLKLVHTPPGVMGAPFFTSDQFYSKLLGIVISLWLLMTIVFNFVTAEKPEVKEPPKVINRVIYKPKKKVEPKKEEKKEEEKKEASSQSKGDEQKKPVKTEEKKEKQVVAKPEKKIVEKVATQTNKTEKIEKKVTKPVKNVVKTNKPVEKIQANQNQKAPKQIVKAKPTKKKSKLNFSKFSGKLKNMMKNSNNVNLQGNDASPTKSLDYAKGASGGLSQGSSTSLVKGASKFSKLSGGGKSQGSLQGKGRIGSMGTGGVGVSFGSDDYVVMGAIDPRVIQNLLRQYLPQFSFCYEKELERIDKEIRAVIKFDFEIGPTGRVRQAKYHSRQYRFSSSMKRCFTKVLKAIPFPAPKGGGTVRIQQPFNMEPRY